MFKLTQTRKLAGAISHNKPPFSLPGVFVDFFVLAGGGGASNDDTGAGAGAGGYRCTVTASGGSPGTVENPTPLALLAPYTITVGAGGTGNQGSSTNGGDSVLGNVTSVGGGAGKGTLAGVVGGSGSGGGGNVSPATLPGAGTANQGYAGGTSMSDNQTYTACGGGGGAGAVGANGTNSAAGNGGNGVANSITGTSVTYGGGGGGSSNYRTDGTGGSGGGANAPNNNGGTNLGGGAAGNGNGGSGLVVIKIPGSNRAKFSSGVTHGNTSPWNNGLPITSVSGYNIYVVSAAGAADTVTIV